MRLTVTQVLTWSTVVAAVAAAMLLASAGFGPVVVHPAVPATAFDDLLPAAKAPVAKVVRPPAGRAASSPSTRSAGQ